MDLYLLSQRFLSLSQGAMIKKAEIRVRKSKYGQFKYNKASYGYTIKDIMYFDEISFVLTESINQEDQEKLAEIWKDKTIIFKKEEKRKGGPKWILR